LIWLAVLTVEQR